LGTTSVTNQDYIHEEIKSKLNLETACYHSVQNFLSSCLPKNLKNKIYKTIILPIVLYRCWTRSLTLRKEHGLNVFENWVLGRISGAKREEVTGRWGNFHNEEFHNFYSLQNNIRVIRAKIINECGM
jgi:hypothetical protein